MADKRTKAELIAAMEELVKENKAQAARLSNAEIAYKALRNKYNQVLSSAKPQYQRVYITISTVTKVYDVATGIADEYKSITMQGKGYVDTQQCILFVSKQFPCKDGNIGSETVKYKYTTCNQGIGRNNFYGQIDVVKSENVTIYTNYSVSPLKDFYNK